MTSAHARSSASIAASDRALPNASILIRPPSGGFQRQASDILIHAEESRRSKERMTRAHARHCGRSYEAFERAMDRDHFMTPEEALDWGLIDRILTEREAPRPPGQG